MHILLFVNTVNFMNDFLSPKNSTTLVEKDQKLSQFSEKGIYVREDDQDWGSAGMDNIQNQKDSE